MKSITQIQHELDGQTLISNFFRLIGLGKICKAVNFNRSSSVSLASIIAWLFELQELIDGIFDLGPKQLF